MQQKSIFSHPEAQRRVNTDLSKTMATMPNRRGRSSLTDLAIVLLLAVANQVRFCSLVAGWDVSRTSPGAV